MKRTTAVEAWREVCGSDLVMAMLPTGRLLEAFAARIEANEREACAKACEEVDLHSGDHLKNSDTRVTCAAAIRAR